MRQHAERRLAVAEPVEHADRRGDQRAVRRGRVRDDRLGLGPQGGGDRVAVRVDPQPVLHDQHPGHGREHGRGPGPHVPQRVGSAADRGAPRERAVRPQLPAVSASVTAPSWACAGDPTIASSRIAATPSPPPRTSMSTRTSGSRRWSTTRHTSPSQRIGARNPAPAARSSRGPSAPRERGPGATPPPSTASGSPSSSRAACADSCWSSCAAPMTDPTEVITSPANWRKNRRRLGSGGVIGSAGRAGAVGWAGGRARVAWARQPPEGRSTNGGSRSFT